MDLLVARIGQHRIGFDSSCIQRVTRAVAVCPLPGAPSAILGLVDVEGSLVPLLDLRARLSLSRVPLNPNHQFIFAFLGSRQIAMVADEVEGLFAIDFSHVDPVPICPGVAHIAGVARFPQGLVLIQDPTQVFDQADNIQLELALSARGAS